MKKILFALLFLTPALLWAEKTPNPADFTTAVHVQSSHLVSICTENWGFFNSGGAGKAARCSFKQQLNVVINGKKYELNSKDEITAVFRTGDYKAKEIPGATPLAVEYNAAYDFLFPDGTVRRYIVVGESE
jgi:hypothetical protein